MGPDRFQPVIVRWGHASHEVSIRLAIAAVNAGSRGSCTFPKRDRVHASNVAAHSSAVPSSQGRVKPPGQAIGLSREAPPQRGCPETSKRTPGSSRNSRRPSNQMGTSSAVPPRNHRWTWNVTHERSWSPSGSFGSTRVSILTTVPSNANARWRSVLALYCSMALTKRAYRRGGFCRQAEAAKASGFAAVRDSRVPGLSGRKGAASERCVSLCGLRRLHHAVDHRLKRIRIAPPQPLVYEHAESRHDVYAQPNVRIAELDSHGSGDWGETTCLLVPGQP